MKPLLVINLLLQSKTNDIYETAYKGIFFVLCLDFVYGTFMPL